MAIILFLLNNSDTWSGLKEDHLPQLENIQLYFLCSLLAVPKSTPKPALYMESDTMLMKYRIYRSKLNLVKYISLQNQEESLAKEVLVEQIKNNWPGLVKEAQTIAEELELEGLLDDSISMKNWKKITKSECKKRNDKFLTDQLKSYKKLDALKQNPKNSYFKNLPLAEVRALFKYRCEMFDDKYNFKNNNKYKLEKYICDSCLTETDTNLHVMECEAYSHLRLEKNLEDDHNLAKYLQKVLNIRLKQKLVQS